MLVKILCVSQIEEKVPNQPYLWGAKFIVWYDVYSRNTHTHTHKQWDLLNSADIVYSYIYTYI